MAGRSQTEVQPSHNRLVEGRLYTVNGGVFRAVRSPETERLELWTHEGQSGQVIARTGLVIDDEGSLYDRIFDFALERKRVVDTPCGTVADLQPVSEAELGRWATKVGQDTSRKIDAGIWER